MLNKETIKAAFSKSAATYDGASDFQKETGQILMDMILKDRPAFARILDVGTGTGSMAAALLKDMKGVFYGCDIAWGMASFAKKNTRGLFIVQADAESLPYKDGEFDTVFSNITYQWMHDMPSAFKEAGRVLKKGGRFYFSILLKGSLAELYEALAAAGKNNLTGILPEENLLKSGLTDAGLAIGEWQVRILKRPYQSCLDFVKALRLIGAGKIQEDNIFKMGERAVFFNMVNFYDENFRKGGKVFATYRVALGCAKKT